MEIFYSTVSLLSSSRPYVHKYAVYVGACDLIWVSFILILFAFAFAFFMFSFSILCQVQCSCTQYTAGKIYVTTYYHTPDKWRYFSPFVDFGTQWRWKSNQTANVLRAKTKNKNSFPHSQQLINWWLYIFFFFFVPTTTALSLLKNRNDEHCHWNPYTNHKSTHSILSLLFAQLVDEESRALIR